MDAVLIATRNPQHAPQSVAALRAGKHVFVEKPMALTDCRSANDLYRAAQENGRHLTVGFNRRFAPYYVAVKNALKGRVSPGSRELPHQFAWHLRQLLDGRSFDRRSHPW